MIVTPPPSLDSMIARSCEFIVNKWWPGRGYPQGIPNIVWTPGNPQSQEHAVRGAAMAALTLATPVYLGTRSVWVPQAGMRSVRDHAARLLAAVARQHRAAPGRTGQYWGGTWQSPLWASWAGLAAMIGWHDLIADLGHRANVLAMLEYEADYVLSLPVEFWRDGNGQPGTKHDNNGNPIGFRDQDTAAEESTWRAQVLWTAAALMPLHENNTAWRTRALELNVTSFAHVSDMSIAPQQVKNIIGGRGYNVDNLYTVHNHNRIHPDYATNVAMNAWGAVTQTLAGQPFPMLALWNLVPVWDALQVSDLDASGTRAYDPQSPYVKFPVGTPSDWGWRRPHAYAVFDSIAAWAEGLQQRLAPFPPEHFALVHLADAGDMQFRATSSTHPYGAFVDTAVTPREATYPEEEVYASSQLCFLRLFQEVQGRVWLS